MFPIHLVVEQLRDMATELQRTVKIAYHVCAAVALGAGSALLVGTCYYLLVR